MAGVTLLLVGTSVAAIEDVNGELANAWRSDVIGPEMWTATQVMSGDKSYPVDGTAAAFLRHEQPSTFFGEPRPGLNGRLHIVHETAFNDAFCPVITDGGKEVRFAAVRNHWTPAGVTTYYQAEPLAGREDDTNLFGGLVLKETKAITVDNVFVCEAEIKNTLPGVRTVFVTFKTPKVFPKTPKLTHFNTTSYSRAVPREAVLGWRSNAPTAPFAIKAHGAVKFRYAFAVEPTSPERCSALLDAALSSPTVFTDNAAAFNRWFADNVPALKIGNADMKKLYLYRWFVVKRAIHEARRVIAKHEYPRRTVYESPTGSWFNCVIGLPVPVHVQEMAWMRDPGVVRDDLLNWCERVQGYDGYIQFTGMTAARLLKNHPDRAFAEKIYAGVKRDALARAGGGKGHLPVQTSSWPTGAEYQPNFYQFTEKYGDKKWDYRHDVEFRRQPTAAIIRVDTCSFYAANLLGAAKIAKTIGKDAESADLKERGEAILKSVKEKLWDEKLGLFLAAEPTTLALADEAACYDSFTPYMFGMVEEKKYFAAFDKFCDPEWFWDDFPISTCAKTCPMYSPDNMIIGPSEATPRKEHRYGCCWNGPTWHYANSLAAEAFGEVALREPSRRAKWVEFFRKWGEMHFLFGDRTAPRAGENVHPETGMRCCATPDYFHSAFLDPFFRYYCGISVSDDLQTVSFEPFTEEDFRLEGVPLAGSFWTFEQKDGKRTFTKDASTN